MGTATGALQGPSRGERASLTRFISRAFRLNIGGQPGSVERRAFKRFALVIPVANLWGAMDVFLFLWFIAPLPALQDRGHVQFVNSIAFLICITVTFVVCGSLSNRCAEPIARWLDSGEPADDEMVRRVLRFPFTQTMLSVYSWAASALAFGLLNATFSPALGIQVGIGILLGGITTCGLLYLLA